MEDHIAIVAARKFFNTLAGKKIKSSHRATLNTMNANAKTPYDYRQQKATLAWENIALP